MMRNKNYGNPQTISRTSPLELTMMNSGDQGLPGDRGFAHPARPGHHGDLDTGGHNGRNGLLSKSIINLSKSDFFNVFGWYAMGITVGRTFRTFGITNQYEISNSSHFPLMF